MKLKIAGQLTRELGSGREGRRKLRYALIDHLARRWGFRAYALNTEWFKNEEFLDVWSDFPEPLNAIQDRRFNLYNLAKAFSRVPGDLAECGVRFGRCSHLMLAATRPIGKHLHGFDSFEGLSEPGRQDRVRVGAQWQWAKHNLSSPEERAKRNLVSDEGRYTLYKGWIPKRFCEVADRTFSFVHVDVDLYQPTRHSYEFFWPRLSPGGAIVCDDYGSVNCPGARKAVDEFVASVGEQVAELATGQALLVKGCG